MWTILENIACPENNHSFPELEVHAKTLLNSFAIYYIPLKPSFVIWLHFECLVPYWPNLPLLISDIRALWRSALNPERQSARMSEIKKVG